MLMGPILSAAAAFAPVIGAGIDAVTGFLGAKNNAQMQKEFAQNGIRWKVEDAKAAGIHPLYALGANTVNFQPSQVGTNFAGAGQDLSRAVDAARTHEERGQAMMNALQLERAGLENDLLRSQIARLQQQQGPGLPGMNYPIPGQAASAALGIAPGGTLEKTMARPLQGQPRSFPFGGVDLLVAPDTGSGQDVEDIIGDDGPGSWVANAGLFARHMFYNLAQNPALKNMSIWEILKAIDGVTKVPFLNPGSPRSGYYNSPEAWSW